MESALGTGSDHVVLEFLARAPLRVNYHGGRGVGWNAPFEFICKRLATPSVCLCLCPTHFSDAGEAKDMVASSENPESAVFFLAFLHDALHANATYLRRGNEKEGEGMRRRERE